MASYEYYDPKPKQKRITIPQNKTNTQYDRDKQIQGYLREADGDKNIAFGEFNWLAMANAIYSLNKTIIEETLKLQEGSSESLKYIEALLDAAQKKGQV